MANDEYAHTGTLPAELDLLLFHAAGIPMAVDTLRVEGIVSVRQAAERKVRIGSLNEHRRPGSASRAAFPQVLLLKTEDDPFGIGIDGLDTIVSIKIDTVQLLPELLSRRSGPRMFWGLIVQGAEVVLLIDPCRMKKQIFSKAEDNA